MNKAIPVWMHLRAFFFRVSQVFALVFSLTCICGLPARYVAARAGQTQEKMQEKRPDTKPQGDATDTVDPTDPEGKKKEQAQRLFELMATGETDPKLTIDPYDPRLFVEEPPVHPPTLLNPLTPAPKPKIDRVKQIPIPPRLRRVDLTAVHEINRRFLLDVPMLNENLLLVLENSVRPREHPAFDARELSRESLENEFAKTRVITAAKLGNGTEVLTVIDMPYSIDAGTLVARMVELTKDADNTAQVRKIVAEQGPGARLFFYGNLDNIDLTAIADECGVELIRRINKTRDLVSVQQRLDTIAKRGFDPQDAVIFNGLPNSQEAVESMGPFAGPVEKWLSFHESIDSIIPPEAKTMSGKEGLFREFQSGEKDLLVFAAHSDGFHFFLNGSRVSLEDISRLPDRQEPSERPRLALLAICNAGEVDSPSLWKKMLRRDYAPLAQLLVEKGFFDKVIAPDHAIGPEEALEAITKALSGHFKSIFKHWIEWAVLVRPVFGVPS